MPEKMMENVKTMNSVVRTGIMVLVLAGLSYGGYLAYTNYIKPGMDAKKAMADLEQASAQLDSLKQRFDEQSDQVKKQQVEINEKTALVAEQGKQIENQKITIEAQVVQIETLDAENEQLQMANKLLKVDQRLARLKILDKGNDEATGEAYMLVEFVEVDEDGKKLGDPKQFRLMGERLYVDALIVKFDDEYVEQADALRSTSMYMFKRIFGEDDGLAGGHLLDVDDDGNVRAAAYERGSKMNDFEKKIWRDFWTISNDPVKQREFGIRNNHGQINYIDAKPGQIYEFTLRSSDGLSFNVLGEE